MSRPKINKPLITKLAEAFNAVGKLERRGKHANYNYTRATDVFEAVRGEIFKRGVLLLPEESTPEFVDIGPSNGGEHITECRLTVEYTFRDEDQELGPFTVHGVGRDAEDKALYKAQTGAEKALLKRMGMMAEEVDDPEWDGQDEQHDAHDATTAKRIPSSQQPVTHAQIRAFNEACDSSQKTQQEIMQYLYDAHQVSGIKDLRRGKAFTEALRWASNGAGAPPPKPQAVPAQQSALPLRAAPSQVEMRIGNQKISFPGQKDAYSI